MKKQNPGVPCILAGLLLLTLMHPAQLSNMLSATYQKFMLSEEARYRKLCPAINVPYSQVVNLPTRIQCFWNCLYEGTCTFFTNNDTACSLWSFNLDPNYDGIFPPPHTPAYWVIRNSTPPPLDVALGRTVNDDGTFPGYSPSTMLTGGSGCFKNKMEDCYCTLVSENWLAVDLGSSKPVTKIVVTAPGFSDVNYFKSVTIRIGNQGDQTDPFLAKTPSTAPSAFQKFEYTVTGSSFRYIWMKRDDTAALCLCKIQAYL